MKWLFIIMICFVNCNIAKPDKENNIEIKPVLLVLKLPTVLDNGEVIHFTDSSMVYHDDKYFVYTVNSSNNLKILFPGGESSERDEALQSYYAFLQKSKTGFIFRSDWETVGVKPFSVDSFVSHSFLKQLTPIINRVFRDYSLHEKYKDSANLIEKYIFLKAKDSTRCDTAILYYSFPFTEKKVKISGIADSLKNGNLYKARLIYNPGNTTRNDGKEIIFEVRYLDTPIPGSIRKIFSELNDKKM